MSAAADMMDDEDTVVLDVSQAEMEEGELSDDGGSLPDTAKPGPVRTPIKMDLPDLLKELKGAEDFKKIDAESVSKMSARAERFQTGNSVSFEEISKLYSSMKVSPLERESESVHRLEMIYVWSPANIDLAEVQRFFSGHHPLSVDSLGRTTAQVVWATPANAARAMLELSKGVGVPGTERVVRHVLDMEQDQSYVSESPVGTDLIHPDDIGVTLPDEEGPWRLAVGDVSTLLLRFGRKTDLSKREKQAAARHLGILSKSRREELMQEQEKALQKELEKKKPVDKKNPWGGAAKDWALESRGRVGTDFDDFLAAYTRDRRRKDWDDPTDADEDRVGQKRKSGGIRARLGWTHNKEEEEEEEDLEWNSRMKRPRMGMVADMVEKDRRKLPRRYLDDEEEDEEEVEEVDLREKVKVRVEDRVVRTAGRRLGERLGERPGERPGERFRGGRLEGRLGLAVTGQEDTGGRHSRLSSRLGARRGNMTEPDSGDSLERDNGEDLGRDMMVNNMVIRVNRSQDEMQVDDDRRGSRGRDDEERRKGERSKNTEEREKEIRQRLREIQREKDLIEERRKQPQDSRSSRRERDGRREEEDSRVRQKSKKIEKYKSGRREEESEDSQTDSSESEDSDDSEESSEESSGSDSDSSDSESSESSEDSEQERRRRREKERGSSSRHRKEDRRDRERPASSKHSKPSSSSKKDKKEDSKKAAELRDQLRNYLKKAKEAKEKRKK